MREHQEGREKVVVNLERKKKKVMKKFEVFILLSAFIVVAVNCQEFVFPTESNEVDERGFGWNPTGTTRARPVRPTVTTQSPFLVNPPGNFNNQAPQNNLQGESKKN